MPYGRGLTARGIRSLYVGVLRAAEVDDGGGGTVWWRGCSVHAAPAHRLARHFSATMLPLRACGADKVAPRACGCGRSRNHLCGCGRSRNLRPSDCTQGSCAWGTIGTRAL